ncbi:hypothetical protein COCNU_scaffold000183G000010 [Cocos nucifera]|nr:hypothetical protein [Cocos nucifera]
MRDLNVKFDQLAFIKGFELYEDKVVSKFSELDLSFLGDEVSDEEAGPSTAVTDPSPTKVVPKPSEPTAKVPEPAQEPKNSFGNQSHDPPSPVEADPLPQGIPLKSMVKNLKKEVHNLKKKLKKVEDELQKSSKDCSEVTIEITCLCQVHKKELMGFLNKMRHLIEKLEWAQKLGSEKIWSLTTKACSLKVELKATQERIQVPKESSAWSTSQTKYGWD